MSDISRVDMHSHSTASQLSRLGVQRALGVPECATPPEEVYALAKRRGMDFVTITDQGDARAGAIGADLEPGDARALLRAWLASVDLRHLSGPELIAWMQSDGFSHADLFRRARRAHERKLAAAVGRALAAAADSGPPAALVAAGQDPRADGGGLAAAAFGLFDACVAAVPYAPAGAFLGREKRRLVAREHGPVRVALVADGIGAMHGVTHTLDEIRDRGVPGFEVEVIGTDRNVDRRLGAVAEVDVPFYPGLQVGVPALPAVVEAVAEGGFDVLHLVSPGPCGVLAALVGRILALPTIGSYHTELAAYAALRSGDPRLALAVRAGLGAIYGQCAEVLSPSAAADAQLADLGVPAERVARWDRGVDVTRFDPALRDDRFARGGRVNVLYAGRLAREKGVELLAEAFCLAREHDPRLHLLLAGGGPEEEALRGSLGQHATFLGWLDGEELAATYASADLFLFASATDTVGLAASRAARERLARGGLAAVCERTWQASLERLAAGYARTLAGAAAAARDAA